MMNTPNPTSTVTMQSAISEYDIVLACAEDMDRFTATTGPIQHEIKGMLNSEMLLFCSMSRRLGARNIVESGRARGNSTHILCRFFETDDPLPVYSIEYNRYSPDALIAMRRLHTHYKMLSMLFGNASYLLPLLCAQLQGDLSVLIDGPKGSHALRVAAALLKNPSVKAVFLHDMHKGTPERTHIDDLFPVVYATDSPDFVKQFRHLDDPCWAVYRNWKGYEDWGPYKRGHAKTASYGPTLVMILNAETGIDKEKEVSDRTGLEPLRVRTGLMLNTLRGLRTLLPRDLSEVPYLFKYHATHLRMKLS